MATIVELDGIAPSIGEGVFLAPTAVLAGDVRVGDRANIWFGAVLRGDTSYIEIGAESSSAGAMLAAGAVLPERVEVASGVLAAGVPAREKKRLSGSAQRWTRTAADEYQQFSKRYMTATRVREAGESRVA